MDTDREALLISLSIGCKSKLGNVTFFPRFLRLTQNARASTELDKGKLSVFDPCFIRGSLPRPFANP